ncbi:MAG: GNAT family N-acetyltransferase [Lachnospiraceae bacterium]|nr:GNAT family N-acetyltransferase [Lachnospiraceae bacterium]
MVTLYIPTLEDLWFRQKFLSDSETMSYNYAWGGTIDFPENKWANWYDFWIRNPENKRFYRYLMKADSNLFVGEAAYHYDEKLDIFIADIIIPAQYRGQGYGTAGLNLLCEAAKNNGIETLYDDIAIDNPAIDLFLKNGFREEYRTNEIIMLKKELRG